MSTTFETEPPCRHLYSEPVDGGTWECYDCGDLFTPPLEWVLDRGAL